ncbi:hypothetical protein ASPZODRAFT_20351 [Penicilliopsis zonata CBS 506.65]|uniref:Uncharacterized protein n=1 Tax=Penicilliopsis zonata CBS 506.65 TaxID=1073090 RepID=A0A1L9S5Z9_9EURO|nr:hypothetical protein ASPZODRAFT_20351 [Penicilliopsis zonata CBS 506.65]OJJ42584.1 hypothetical protein ASPZODRAFT_20351 [Penicilliopsis zonata CBS 506.65]
MANWFSRRLTAPGAHVQLNRAQWTIVEEVDRHNLPVDEEDFNRGYGPLYSCVQLLCHSNKEKESQEETSAFMLIYLQTPILGTEGETLATRSQQATQYTPSELAALQTFTERCVQCTPRLLDWRSSRQEKDSPVPEGFIVWVVWEIVPGTRLGDAFGGDIF